MNLDSAVFYTNDLNKVIEFYRDVLSFEVEYIQDGRFVSFIFPNGAKLGIKKADAEREIPGAQTVIFQTSGIHELNEELKAKNLTFYKELSAQDWGTNFSILDPDGNKVEFFEIEKLSL